MVGLWAPAFRLCEPLVRRFGPVARPVADRVMKAHRRYTSANGDALAGALTYALLVGSAPAVLLCSAALAPVSGGHSLAGSALLRDAHVLLPGQVVHAVDGAGSGAVPWRLSLIVLLAWFSLRLVRALRTGVRAMCGQNAGSGNPLRDWLGDVLLGLVLMGVVISVVIAAAATAGHWWSPVASIAAVWLLFTAIMLRASRKIPGRPPPAVAMRAALAAALLCAMLARAAHHYFVASSALHAEIYQAAGALIGVLVWCSLTCRILFRAVAWASTAPGSASAVAAREVSAPTGSAAGGGTTPELWVVVPAYNEAAAIGGVLSALAAQTDRDFALVVVDNGSTDGTADVARAFAASAPFPAEVIGEPARGPGPAADAGFRHAIGCGAMMLARTDADCVPAPDWVAAARSALLSGAEMACGRSVPRLDERPTVSERHLLPAAIQLAGLYGRYRRAHRDNRYRTPYVLCQGHNIALTADLYLRCGGTPRVAPGGSAEDVGLLNRAREHSDRVIRAEQMVVQHSLRRLRAWGARRTLLWYWDRRYRPASDAMMDVR